MLGTIELRANSSQLYKQKRMWCVWSMYGECVVYMVYVQSMAV